MKELLKSVGIVFIACAVAAAGLSFVYGSTKDRIAEQARLETEAALKLVFPDAQGFGETLPGKQWEVDLGDQEPGTAVATVARGYSGPISMMIGVDGSGVVTGVRVLSHTETPGLGAKITTADFLAQFRGKTAGKLQLRRDNPQAGGIDAITAATISSRAVTDTVLSVVEFLK